MNSVNQAIEKHLGSIEDALAQIRARIATGADLSDLYEYADEADMLLWNLIEQMNQGQNN